MKVLSGERNRRCRTGPVEQLRRTYFGLLLVIVVLAVGFGYAMLKERGSGIAYVRVETEKSMFELGEAVKISVTLVNEQDAELSLTSLSYGLEIRGSQSVVFIMNVYQTSEGEVVLEPNSQLFVGDYLWNQRDMNNDQVTGGTYEIRVCMLDLDICESTTIRIE